MKANIAVVSTKQPNKIILSGTHKECVKFVNVNNWLYEDTLILRYIDSNGILGDGLRPFLWRGK